MNRRLIGIFAILVPLAFNIAFFALGSAFEYPDILRQPTGDILTKFVDGGSGLVALWYIFATTAVLAIPLALLLYSVFRAENSQLSLAAAVIGVLSGLVQVIGLYRWVFLVPFLASAYTDPAATPAAQETAAIVFESAHRFLGVAVGEHLGYLFTGGWTILLSIMMFRSRQFHPILGIIGIVSALGIMAGMLEPAGWSDAGAINAIAYIGWSLWLVALGVFLIIRPQQETAASA